MIRCYLSRMANLLTFTLFLVVMPTALIASPQRGLSITVTEEGEKRNLPLYSNSYALVIGNDAYQDDSWPPLSGAIEDAEAVADELTSRGFEVTLLKNLNSTELQKAINRFVVFKGKREDSRLFIWFAGHGHTMEGEGYLVPVNAPSPELDDGAEFIFSALPMRRFGEFMRKAKSRHVLAVFDSCFSGTVFDTARSKPPAVVDRAVSFKVRQFVSSGDAKQTVSDNGMFRSLFLDAITGRDKRADMNDDGYILGSELGLYLQQRMTSFTESHQTPRWGKLNARNYDLGDFVFKIPSPQINLGQRQIKTSQLDGGSTISVLQQQQLLLKQMQDQLKAQQAQMEAQEKQIASLKKLGAIASSASNDTDPEIKYSNVVSISPAEKYKIGICYLKGECGKRVNTNKARQYLEGAANAGNTEAQYALARHLQYDRLDLNTAKHYYRLAARTNHRKAKEALEQLEKSSRSETNGNNEEPSSTLYTNNDKYLLGICYMEGECGKRRDTAKARKWLGEAALLGHVKAQFRLGKHYQFDRFDLDEAKLFYELAAAQGHSDAKSALKLIEATLK